MVINSGLNALTSVGTSNGSGSGVCVWWENVCSYREEKDEEGDDASRIDYTKWVYF